ncbi:hypothetical protein D3C73_1338240 [compost metagenome]
MNLVKHGIVLLLVLDLTGCWSKIELDKITFIFGMYVDAGKKPGTVVLLLWLVVEFIPVYYYIATLIRSKLHKPAS